MKQILLTGASRGLGLAMAEHLLRAGWYVTALQRSQSAGLAALQTEFTDRLRVFAVDLSQIERLESEFRDTWFPQELPVAGLVNNAAVAYDDLLTNLDTARYEAMHRVNVVAPMVLSKSVIRRCLLHRQPASLVHISSVCAHTGYKGLSMYGATKGSLEAFSLNLAREWGSREIRSNCVVPGFMETEMSQSLTAETRDKIYRRTALQQPTQLASVAATVGYLLSDASCSVTGTCIRVDAGTL